MTGAIRKISPESIAELRQLLSQEFDRPFTVAEAESIGTWLIEFYGHLAKKNLGQDQSGQLC